MEMIKEDRHTLPPNFSYDDWQYVKNQGAVFHQPRGADAYITVANYAVLHRLNILWEEYYTSK